MFRAKALRHVGLFDEGFFLYHEEVELMWRFRQLDWRIALEPRSRVRHVGGAATGMHGRDNEGALQRRRPKYWFRSRARYFSLTRGWPFAMLAYYAWIAGHFIWLLRRLVGLGRDSTPIDHAFCYPAVHSFPRRRDTLAAVRTWDTPGGALPAWMHRGRL